MFPTTYVNNSIATTRVETIVTMVKEDVMLEGNNLQAVYDMLKNRYPVELTNGFALDDGFTADIPVIVGRHHGEILYLFDDGDMFVLDVCNDARTEGTHWHPLHVEEAANDIADFMEGRIDYELIPFSNQ